MSTQLFATFKFHDAQRAIGLLKAMGFTQSALYTDDSDPAVVHHAEFAWRDRGGIMFGSTGAGGAELDRLAGQGTCYCVTETDQQVDAIHAAALAAGATSLNAPYGPDQGGRECAVTDPEGNIFTFGSYAGQDAATA